MLLRQKNKPFFNQRFRLRKGMPPARAESSI